MANTDNRNELTRLSEARLPYHPALEERFGIDRAGWRALTDAVWPAARSVDAIVNALSYCRARRLDPFKRPVHIVPTWSRSQNRMIETVWPGIGELRTTAFRTGLYAGRDRPEFGPDKTVNLGGIDLTFPEYCEITVYRLDRNNQRMAYPGPRVYWLESYGTAGRDTVAPNEMWRKRPRGQLEKCAEAAALRAAFPEEIGNDYTDDEMHGQVIEHDTPPPQPPQENGTPPAKPPTGNAALRARLAAQEPEDTPEAPEAPEDQETETLYSAATGEVVEPDPAPPPTSEDGSGMDDSPLPPSQHGDDPSRSEFAVITPKRIKRNGPFDWAGYADDVITAAANVAPRDMRAFAARNRSMLDALKLNDGELWARVQHELARLERT